MYVFDVTLCKRTDTAIRGHLHGRRRLSRQNRTTRTARTVGSNAVRANVLSLNLLPPTPGTWWMVEANRTLKICDVKMSEISTATNTRREEKRQFGGRDCRESILFIISGKHRQEMIRFIRPAGDESPSFAEARR